MSTKTQLSVREQARAVFLALIMVTSIVAMSVGFSATVTAEEEPEPRIEWEEEIDSIIDNWDGTDEILYDEDENVLYVLGENQDSTTTLWAVDRSDDSITWEREPSISWFDPSLAHTDDYVAVAGSDDVVSFEKSTGDHTSTYSNYDSNGDIAGGDEFFYVGGEIDFSEHDVVALDDENLTEELTIMEEPGGFGTNPVEIGLDYDDGQLAVVYSEEDKDNEWFLHDLSTDPLVSSEISSDDLSFSFSYTVVEVELANETIYTTEEDEGNQLRAADRDGSGFDEDWRNNDDLGLTLAVDDRWAYVDDVAYDRDDGTEAWSLSEDTSANPDTSSGSDYAISLGSSSGIIDLYVAGTDGDHFLWGVTDGIVSSESSSTDGSITTTVDAPHPDVSGIELTAVNPGGDIIETGVGQPETIYELEIELDGYLAEVDEVETDLYRVDESDDRLAEDPAADEYYNLTVEFEQDGDATVSSDHNSDTQLSSTAIDGIDREAEVDNTTIEITFPEDVRPSANTQDSGVNDYSWEVALTPVNLDIEDEDDPETLVDQFDIGVLVDATINTGEVKEQEDLVLPGDENVAHAPDGEEDSVKIEAGGNVEIGVDMSASDLDHETEDDTISADQTKVLAGEEHTLSNHGHENVTQLANDPTDIDASDLTHGESEEVRMWIDYPEEIEPGEYNGEFTFTVTEVGAS